MMAEKFEMVIVDGVRYRPEDAPSVAEKPAQESAKKAIAKPANKARTASDK